MDLSFGTLRKATAERLPLFKNQHGEPANHEPDGSDWSDSDWLQAVVGELGEYANLKKKVLRGDILLEDARPLLADELADVVIYLDILAMRLGIDLGMAVVDKFDRVSERVGAPVFLGQCPFCAEGEVPIQSSVSDAKVHISYGGRLVCRNRPAKQ